MITAPLSSKFIAAATVALFVSSDVAPAAVQSVILISGLNDPRDVAVAPNGDIYVIEAGTGFDTTGMTPIDTDTGPSYFGKTGSITLLSGGATSRPVLGLPMLYNPNPGGETVGGQGIAVTSSGLTYSIGLGSTVANRAAGLPETLALGTLNTLTPASQTDIASSAIGSSNPFHLTLDGGRTILADSGDNSVYSIENGVVSRVGYLPDIAPNVNFVPTGVAVNSSGGIFVGGLSGFPFIQGSAPIYLMENGNTSMFAGGFTNIVDIAMGSEGSLYVLEYATNGILSGDPTGGLWSLSSDGLSRELLMSTGLVSPTGLTVGPDGTLYVTHNGGSAGSGQLLAITIPETSSAGLAALALGLAVGRRRRVVR